MATTKKDKNARVFVKATSWRFFATCDTIFLSWLFTGHIEAAFKIGLTEVVTKIGLFYLHERLWDRLGFGLSYTRNENGEIIVTEKHYRSIVKGASWRFFGTMDTIIIALFWTGDYTKALAIGATEVLTKIALFWLHERVWLKVKWGRVNKEIIIKQKEEINQTSQQFATVNVSAE